MTDCNTTYTQIRNNFNQLNNEEIDLAKFFETICIVWLTYRRTEKFLKRAKITSRIPSRHFYSTLELE